MNNNDLKDFVIDNISLQIKNTIGNDEELEAWNEMEDFFKDDFENTIKEIKVKLGEKKGDKSNSNFREVNIETEEKREDKKLDMWED